jgi:hypothetical protein
MIELLAGLVVFVIFGLAVSFDFLKDVTPGYVPGQEFELWATYIYDEDGWASYAWAIHLAMKGEYQMQVFGWGSLVWSGAGLDLFTQAMRSYPLGFNVLMPMLMSLLFFVLPRMASQWVFNFTFHLASIFIVWKILRLFKLDTRGAIVWASTYGVMQTSACFRFGDAMAGFTMMLFFYAYAVWFKDNTRKRMLVLVLAELLMIFTREISWPMIIFPVFAYLLASPFIVGSGRRRDVIVLLFLTAFLPVVVMVLFLGFTQTFSLLELAYSLLYLGPRPLVLWIVIFLIAFGISPFIACTVKPKVEYIPSYAWITIFIASRLIFGGAIIVTFFQGCIFAIVALQAQRPRSFWPTIAVNVILAYLIGFTDFSLQLTRMLIPYMAV